MQIGEELGYVKKFRINPYGFKEIIFSSSIYHNQNSTQKLPKSKNNGTNHTGNHKIDKYKSEKKFYDNGKVLIYKSFKNDEQIKGLYVEFNQFDLVCQVFFVEINNIDNKQNSNVIYKKADYDTDGNIIELKEWRSKNYEQFEKVISDNGEEVFVDEIFNSPEKFFKLTFIDTKIWRYKDGRLKSSSVLDGLSNEEINKEEFRYDSKKRLIEVVSYQTDKMIGKDVFTYN